MIPKFPLTAKNASANTIVDITQFTVPDGSITAGSGVIDLTSTGTADVVGPTSAADTAIAIFNGTTGKVVKDGGMTLPAASGVVGYLNIPQNPQTVSYTTVAADTGKEIYHAVGAGAGDAYTIASNATVPYAIGTTIVFTNMATDAITVIIASDTLNYVNVGAVTTITVPQFNQVVARKVTTTAWLASGSAGVTTA